MLKILMIDDEEILCQSMEIKLKKILGADGFEFSYALKGEEGVNLAHCIKPNIAIVDYQLPDMKGNEVIGEIRRLSPHTCLIALSAFEDYKYVRSMFAAGVMDYLLKPVSNEELLRCIRGALKSVAERDYFRITDRGTAMLHVMTGIETMRSERFVEALMDMPEFEEIFPQKYFLAAQLFRTDGSRLTRALMEQLVKSMPSVNMQILFGGNGEIIAVINGENVENDFMVFVDQCRYLKLTDLVIAASEGGLMGMDGLYLSLVQARHARIAAFLHPDKYLIRYVPEQTQGKSRNLFDLYDWNTESSREVLLAKLESAAHGIRAMATCEGATAMELEREYATFIAALNGCLYQNGEVSSGYQSITRFGTLEQISDYLLDCVAVARGSVPDAREDLVMQKAAAYIRKHYAETLTIRSLSEKFFLNYTYFSEQFKREIGKAPIQYITEIRINHAKLLLREHRYTIEEIARSVGYQSGKTFSQAFTQIVGVSPKKYAKSAKEGKNP